LPFKVEGIFALQYRRFFNRSCHNQYAFIGLTGQRYKNNFKLSSKRSNL
jgi:hypothetical protein